MIEYNLDSKTIKELGLYQSGKPINAHTAPEARIFQMPNLENVYIMESDLYGNTMPAGSCFLAFNGRNGLMGTHIRIDILRKSSIKDIKKIVGDSESD